MKSLNRMIAEFAKKQNDTSSVTGMKKGSLGDYVGKGAVYGSAAGLGAGALTGGILYRKEGIKGIAQGVGRGLLKGAEAGTKAIIPGALIGAGIYGAKKLMNRNKPKTPKQRISGAVSGLRNRMGV